MAASDEPAADVDDFPDPAASRAVVIGLSDYESEVFPRVPATRTSAYFWHDLFRAEHGWALPDENCTFLIEDGNRISADQILKAVETAARAATDTLAVVYCGHAVEDREGKLQWILTQKRDTNIRTWGLAFDRVVGAMASGDSAGSTRRLVVLDSCHAGAAGQVIGTSGFPEQQNNDNGLRHLREHGPQLLVACAAPSDSLGDSSSAGGLTGFTQAVQDVVAAFQSGDDDVMRLGKVMEAVQSRRRAGGEQEPTWFSEGPAHDIPLLRKRPPERHETLPPLVRALAHDIALCATTGDQILRHPAAVLRVEKAPIPGLHTLRQPRGAPAGRLRELLGILPTNSDVPICLLARAWQPGRSVGDLSDLLCELMLSCHIGRATHDSRAGGLDHGAVVLTLDPAEISNIDTPRVSAVVGQLLDGAETLLPRGADGPAHARRWTGLPTGRARCGSEFLRRRLPELLVAAGRDEEAGALVRTPEWVTGTIRVLGHAGPVVAGARSALGDHPFVHRLARIAHLLRVDGSAVDTVDDVLADRLALIDVPNRSVSARLALLVPDEEFPAVRHVYAAHRRPGPKCCVDSDGTYGVSVDGTDAVMHVWDPATGEPLGRARGSGGDFTGCAVLPGRAQAVTVAEEGRLTLWDCRAPQTPLAQSSPMSHGSGHRIVGVVGDHILVSDSQGLSVWRTSQGLGDDLIAVAHLRHPRMAGAVAAPVEDGIAVLVITDNWYAHRWTLPHSGGAVLDRSFTPLARRESTSQPPPSTRCAGCCVGPSVDGDIPVLLFGRFPDTAVHATWRPCDDGKDPTQFRLAPETAALWKVAAFSKHLTAGAFSPDGERLLLVNGDGRSAVLARGHPVVSSAAQTPASVSVHPTRVGAAAVTWIPGAVPRMLTFNDDGRLRVWDESAAESSKGTEYQWAAPVGCLLTDESVLVPRVDRTITHTGFAVGPLEAESSRSHMVLPPQASLPDPAPRVVAAAALAQGIDAARPSVASALGLDNGEVQLVAANGDIVAMFRAHRAAVTALAAPSSHAVTGLPWSANWILTASRIGEVRMWDVTGTPVREWGTARRFPGTALLACVTANGSRAVVCTDRAVHILTTPATPTTASEPFPETVTLFPGDFQHTRITAVCADPRHDGRIFAAGHGRVFKIFPASSNTIGDALVCAEHSEITALAVHQGSGRIALCDTRGLVTVRDGDGRATPIANWLAGTPVGAAWLAGGDLAIAGTAGVALLRPVPPAGQDTRTGPLDGR